MLKLFLLVLSWEEEYSSFGGKKVFVMFKAMLKKNNYGSGCHLETDIPPQTAELTETKFQRGKNISLKNYRNLYDSKVGNVALKTQIF